VHASGRRTGLEWVIMAPLPPAQPICEQVHVRAPQREAVARNPAGDDRHQANVLATPLVDIMTEFDLYAGAGNLAELDGDLV
jgi:hypothetical protein